MADHVFKVGDKGQTRNWRWDVECVHQLLDGRLLWVMTNKVDQIQTSQITFANGLFYSGEDCGEDIIPLPPPMRRVPYTQEKWPEEFRFCRYVTPEIPGEREAGYGTAVVVDINYRGICLGQSPYRRGFDEVANDAVYMFGPKSSLNGPWSPAYLEVPVDEHPGECTT